MGAPFGDCRRIVSDEYMVDLAGFRATTWQLQQSGWQIAADQDVAGRRIQLLLRHNGLGVYGVSDAMPFDYMGWIREQRQYRSMTGLQPELAFRVRRLSVEMKVDITFAQRFHVIDAMPLIVCDAPRSIEDFHIFSTPLVRTEQIIVEPQSVAECLALIKKMQAPELAEIRERNRRREAMEQPEPGPRQVFHAQILSLAA